MKPFAVLVAGLAAAAFTAGASARQSDEKQSCGSCDSAGEAMLIASDAQEQQPAPAAEMLKAYREVKMPAFDPSRQKDQDYIKEYIQLRNDALKQKVELGRKFVLAYPADAEAPKVASEFVQTQIYTLGQAQQARDDIKTLLAIDSLPAELVKSLQILDATAMLMAERNADATWEQVLELHKKYPADEGIARLMTQVAEASKGQSVIDRYKFAVEAFPDSRATKYARGKIQAAQGIGKPFEFSFNDAVTGETVSADTLKGKVLVIDFWATWCGPCIAEMPKMKELYAQYKERGVEFVGISLDNPEDKGGLEALRKYCKEQQITWPQYYQGKGWESEFSTSSGINSIPAVFVVDAEGNLYSTEARGKLEELIPELLAKRDGEPTASR